MKLFLEKNGSHKKGIIFASISIIAIHTLYFIIVMGGNWHIEIGAIGLPLTESFFTDGKYPYELLITDVNAHIFFFPRLPLLVSFLFDKFDTMKILYFGWILLIIVVFLFYKILKFTDEKLTWFIIPIAAFIFSPIQYIVLLWAFASMAWFIPLLGVLAITYLTNKPKIDNKSFYAALSIGLISSFSLALGPIIMLSGIIPLIITKRNIKQIIIWFSLTLMVFFVYYLSILEDTEAIDKSISSTGAIKTMLQFASSPFRLKFDFLILSVGAFVILFTSIMIMHLSKIIRKEVLLPWIQLFFVGLLSSLMVAFARGATGAYYSTIANLIPITLLVLIALNILFLKNRENKKVISYRFILCLIIIGLLVMLIPSYYLGWKLGGEFNELHKKYNSCFYNSIIDNELCRTIFFDDDSKERIEFFKIITKMKENKVGMFLDNSYSLKNVWSEKDFLNDVIITVNGEIVSINQQDATVQKIIYVDDPLVSISGHVNNIQNIDSLFVVSNDKLLLTITNIQNELNGSEINDSFVKTFEVSFLSSYLESDCNMIKIIGLSEQMKIDFGKEIMICFD